MKFVQFWGLAWLLSCCLSAQSKFGPLCKVQVVTTQLYWDAQAAVHCCTGCSEAPETGFALPALRWSDLPQFSAFGEKKGTHPTGESPRSAAFR